MLVTDLNSPLFDSYASLEDLRDMPKHVAMKSLIAMMIANNY